METMARQASNDPEDETVDGGQMAVPADNMSNEPQPV
jgi:hypothetical protein